MKKKPFFSLIFALLLWFLVPLFPSPLFYYFSSLSLLIFLAILSLGIYPLLLSGWSSNSKFAFLGSLRSVAQLISYEIVLTIIFFILVFLQHTFDLLNWFTLAAYYPAKFFYLFLLGLLFFIVLLSETNRAPFDLSEGEFLLVSGFNLEYSGFFFSYFFLSEYSNILILSYLYIIFFCCLGSHAESILFAFYLPHFSKQHQ